MKSKKLTAKYINSPTSDRYLYAELASGGAMGDPGSARLYTLTRDGELKYYYASLYHDDPEETAGYEALYEKLNEWENLGAFEHLYAGFGNDAYKASDLDFSRDDDNCTFLYYSADFDRNYKLPASCQGVYDHIAHDFARRKFNLEHLKSFVDHSRPAAERAFLKNYLKHCEDHDRGQSWLEFTIEGFQDAIQLIEYRNRRTFNLSYSTIENDLLALEKYRLKYVSELIGWNGLEEVLTDFLDNPKNLFEKLSQKANVDITKKFQTLEKKDSGFASTSCTDPKNLESLFEYPCLVNFTPTAHQKIQSEILKDNGSSLRANARGISYYLANYLNNDDRLPYSDLLPVAVHIIKNLSTDDWNNTRPDQLFWLASEVINRAWMSCDPSLDDDFDRFIYDLYWPRVGALWPIQHREDFDFKEPVASKIFDDSLGFILSLDHLDQYNPELATWLKTTNSKIKANYTVPPAYATRTKEETLEILDNIFNSDERPSYTQLGTLEDVLLHNNYPETRHTLLEYLDEHFTRIANLFENSESSPYLKTPESKIPNTPDDDFATFFTAACEGARFEFERELLKKLKKKFETLDLAEEKDNLDPALAHADQLISAYAFQEQHLKAPIIKHLEAQLK